MFQLFFPAAIHYPMYDVETGTQYFPFKTMSMLSSLFCCVYGSLLTEYLFKSGRLQPEMGNFLWYPTFYI